MFPIRDAGIVAALLLLMATSYPGVASELTILSDRGF
jgi:hypothetical protein